MWQACRDLAVTTSPMFFFGGGVELGNEAGSLFVALGGLNSQRCASLGFPRAGLGVAPALVGSHCGWQMLFTRGSS